MNTQKQMFERGIIGLTILIICIIPFIVANGFFFPFITGKNFAFRVFVELLGFVWILGFLRGAFPKPKKSPVLFALIAFLGLATISTIFSVDPFRSFWSNYERMEGLVTYLHFGVYVFVLASVCKTKVWNLVWATSLGASIAMSFFAMYQSLGYAVINQGASRVDGTFGNSIYLAVYMLFHVFITLIYLRQAFLKQVFKEAKVTLVIAGIALFVFLTATLSHVLLGAIAGLISLITVGLLCFAITYTYKNSSVWIMCIFYALTIVLQTSVMFFTGTRGAVLGLAVGLLVMALGASFSKSISKMEKKCGYIMLGVALFSVLSFFALRNVPAIRANQSLGRIFTASLEDKTVQARFLIWGMALQGAKEYPVLGWGLEGFRNVFDKYYDPKMYAQEQWFDRTHNILFDWLVAGGALGLISYVSLFGALVLMLQRREKELGGESAILLGLLSAYFVHNLFVFDNVGSLILFGALIAYIHAEYHASENYVTPKISIASRIYGQVGAVVLILFLVGVNLYQMNANMLLIKALQDGPQNPTIAPELFKKALDANSYGKTETREQLVQFALAVAGANVPGDTKQKVAALVGTEIQALMKEQPNDARTWLFASLLWRQFGLLPDAEKFARQAVLLSPKKQTLRTEVVNLLLVQKKFNEAYAFAAETLALEPAFDEVRTLTALSAIYAGKKAEAQTLLSERVDKTLAPDTRIIAAYVSINDFAPALALLTEASKIGELSRDQVVLLSSIYLETGKRAQAVIELQKLAKRLPETQKDVDGAIKDINAGKNPFK